jgi:hypothetical protein
MSIQWRKSTHSASGESQCVEVTVWADASDLPRPVTD